MSSGIFDGMTREDAIKALRDDGYKVVAPCKQTKVVAELLEQWTDRHRSPKFDAAADFVSLSAHMEEVAKDALKMAFEYIHTVLGVESGDQCCYFIEEEDADKVREWLHDYALSEINLFADESHPMSAEITYSTKGLGAKFPTTYKRDD